jgi:hypothetical protein
MPPTNKPANPGAFGGFTPISSWSSKSGTQAPAGFNMNQFFGGANVPTSGNTAQDLQNMMRGTNYRIGTAPSLQMYQQGTLYDTMKGEQVARQTQDRNTQFFDQAMANMQRAQQQLNTPSPAWDKAYGFQKQLMDQTKADTAAFEKKAKETEVKFQDQMGRVEGTYNQALGKFQEQMGRVESTYDQALGGYNNTMGRALAEVDEGRDKIASEMAAGMRQNFDLQQEQQMGALMSQGISADQMAEAERQSKYEMERGVGANVSNLQFQGAQARSGILQAQASGQAGIQQSKAGAMQQNAAMQANIQQSKAGAMQGMATSQANLSTTIAQMGLQSTGAKQEAIKMGANIAMANAADDQQRNQMVAQYAMNVGQFGVNFLQANPIIGSLLGGTIAALGKQAGMAGQGFVADDTAMRDRVRGEISRAQSAMAPRGFGQGVDVKALIMRGMQVPGISREAMQWIQQNGLPPDHIIAGEFGGAGRMGYEEGQAPTGLGSTARHDQWGYNHAAETNRRAAEQMPK